MPKVNYRNIIADIAKKIFKENNKIDLNAMLDNYTDMQDILPTVNCSTIKQNIQSSRSCTHCLVILSINATFDYQLLFNFQKYIMQRYFEEDYCERHMLSKETILKEIHKFCDNSIMDLGRFSRKRIQDLESNSIRVIDVLRNEPFELWKSSYPGAPDYTFRLKRSLGFHLLATKFYKTNLNAIYKTVVSEVINDSLSNYKEASKEFINEFSKDLESFSFIDFFNLVQQLRHKTSHKIIDNLTTNLSCKDIVYFNNTMHQIILKTCQKILYGIHMERSKKDSVNDCSWWSKK